MSAIPIVGQGLPSWMVLAAGLLVWVALLWILARLAYRGHERVRCPLTGRMARVTFVRGPDGAREDIVRCSLQPGTIACDRSCRAPA
jgi:hypothetical protein